MSFKLLFYFFAAFFLCRGSFYAQERKHPPLKISPVQLFPFVYQQLGPILSMCFRDNTCSLSSEEKDLVQKINESLPKETQPLYFDSGKTNPDLFFKDGNTRIAVTGNDVGSKIYINMDLAYPKDKLNKNSSLEIDRIIALLTHELGHHHEWPNHDSLDQLGLKIGSYFLDHFQMIEIAGEKNQDPDLRPLRLYLGVVQLPFSTGQPGGLLKQSETLLWVFDEFGAHDVTDKIVSQLQCPGLPQNKDLKSVRIFNWEAIQWRFGSSQDFRYCPAVSPIQTQSYRIDFYTLEADLQMLCQQLRPNMKLSVDLGFHRDCSSKSSLLSESARFVFEGIQNVKILN